jgi:hypothetical protein
VNGPDDAPSVWRTIAALLVAPFGTILAHVAVSAAIGDLDSVRFSPVATLLVAAGAAAAGLLFVLPVLLLVPRLRTLPAWAAAAWGAALALLVTVILVGPSMVSRTSAIAMAVLGAASGITYAIAVRALGKKPGAE